MATRYKIRLLSHHFRCLNSKATNPYSNPKNNTHFKHHFSKPSTTKLVHTRKSKESKLTIPRMSYTINLRVVNDTAAAIDFIKHTY